MVPLFYDEAQAAAVKSERVWWKWLLVGFLSTICLPGQHPKEPQGLIKIIESFTAKVEIGLKSSEIRFDFYEDPYFQLLSFHGSEFIVFVPPSNSYKVLTTQLAATLVCSQIYYYYYYFLHQNMNYLSVSLFFGEKMSHGKVDATEKCFVLILRIMWS